MNSETYDACYSFEARARRNFHAALLSRALQIDSAGIPSNSDSSRSTSVAISKGIVQAMCIQSVNVPLAEETPREAFKSIVCKFISETFPRLHHLRPGKWGIQQITGRERTVIARYKQYAHLVALDKAARKDPELAASLGNDYTITPDIVVVRGLESEKSLNTNEVLVDDAVSRHASLREINGGLPLLHASISCKWTIRSDRVQNARSEALNLIRNRKGRLPHVVVVTGEPLPSRLSAIALGTGDIDCVYHFALPELMQSVETLQMEDTLDLLKVMVFGKRLKDISDLPLDLAI